MKAWNRTWTAAGALLLGGCTTARFYPVCILDTGHAPPAVLWAAARPRLNDVLDKATHGLTSTRLDIDGALVVAATRDHRALTRVWPQYACHIASDTGAGRDILVDDCRRVVGLYLSGQMTYWPASPAEGAPSCAVASDSALR